MDTSVPLLKVEGLGKSYAGPVLADVDLEVRAGEVHALVGENGAGKSTFSRIVAGLVRPDAGRMTLRGVPYAPASRREAARSGVRMVLQELNLIPTLTVAESLFLDCLPRRWGVIDRVRLHEEARSLLGKVGLGGLDAGTLVGELGVGQQQLVEIAAGLARRCDILILDEPTAALTDPEIERLFEQIARLKAEGTAVLYISHRMEEIRRVSDRITVLRDGRKVGTRDAAAVTLGEVIGLMVGREMEETFVRAGSSPGGVALRVEALRAGRAVREVSFEVRAGEILGLAGLLGSGRTETLRAICGADRAESGRVWVGSGEAPVRIRCPRDAVRLGMALLTENRKEQGLLLPQSIRCNVTLPSLPRYARWGWVRRDREMGAVARGIERLNLRCDSVEQRVAELSGGNQQKVVMAKWLVRDCTVLLFDEPTRGIDVAARYEIYRLLDDLAGQGKALVVVSSDLRELMSLADRIGVLSAGRLVATFARGEWSQERIMEAALSGYLGGGD